ELARKRPFGAVAGAQDAAEYLRAGRGAGDLVDLLGGIDGEEADAARKGGGNVALLLDRVAIGDAVGRGAGGERHVDLGDAGAIEARAELGEEPEHLGRR